MKYFTFISTSSVGALAVALAIVGSSEISQATKTQPKDEAPSAPPTASPAVDDDGGEGGATSGPASSDAWVMLESQEEREERETQDRICKIKKDISEQGDEIEPEIYNLLAIQYNNLALLSKSDPSKTPEHITNSLSCYMQILELKRENATALDHTSVAQSNLQLSLLRPEDSQTYMNQCIEHRQIAMALLISQEEEQTLSQDDRLLLNRYQSGYLDPTQQR